MKTAKILLLVFVLMSGCTPALKSVVYNNTNNIVTMELCSKKHEILPSEKEEIFNILCNERPIITIGENTFEYDAKLLNYPIEKKFNNYVKKNLGERVIKYQINKTGVIIIVPINQSFPFVYNIDQTDGFSIKPGKTHNHYRKNNRIST